MDPRDFDGLARNFDRFASRRRLLGGLLGGALLLPGPSTSEAEGPKPRRPVHGDRFPHPIKTRGIAVNMFNGNRQINYSNGVSGLFNCCRYDRDGALAPEQQVSFGTNFVQSPWVWIDDGTYWFQFFNPTIGRPYVQIALNGRNRPSSNCCQVIPYGQTVEGSLSFAENQRRDINIAGKIFRIERRPDTEFVISFCLFLPRDI